MFITFFGFAIGNMLLNISTPINYEPFILISLFSIALIPILLTKKPPKFKKNWFNEYRIIQNITIWKFSNVLYWFYNVGYFCNVGCICNCYELLYMNINYSCFNNLVWSYLSMANRKFFRQF